MAYCAKVYYSFSLSFGGSVLLEFYVLFPTCDLSTLKSKAHEPRVLGQLGLSCKTVTNVLVTLEKHALMVTLNGFEDLNI